MRQGRRFTQRALLRRLGVTAQGVNGPSPHSCGVETSETRSNTNGPNYLTVAHVRVVIDAMRFRS
jgi:hypothetical protein